jgi:hypothetical protein
MIVYAFTEIHAAKIKTQHNAACAAQSLRQTVNHLVMHSAAEQRVRVADETCLHCLTVLRLFQQGFQATGGATEKQRFDASGHVILIGAEIDELKFNAEIRRAQNGNGLL